jgi:methylated-DNA-protein-cysteine methyltransferase-like protein
MDEAFIFQVLEVVKEIPEGKVATYGQIARLIGSPKNPRQVGKALSVSSLYEEAPCHRVVNAKGRLAPHFYEQDARLENEGVQVKEGYVDLKKYQWQE